MLAGNRADSPNGLDAALQSLIWRAFQTSSQFGAVAVEDRQEFVVLDIPKALADMGLAQESEVGHQLAESHVRRQGPYFTQHGQRLTLHLGHGNTSSILASPAHALG